MKMRFAASIFLLALSFPVLFWQLLDPKESLLTAPAIAQKQTQSPVPPPRATVPVLKPCLRQLDSQLGQIESSLLQGAYREQGRTYYLLSLLPVELGTGWDVVVVPNQSGCQVLAVVQTGEPVDAAASLPPSIGRGLTLNALKTRIARAGGTQEYQESLIYLAQQVGNKLRMGAYEIWAYQQLGVKLPTSIRIIKSRPQ